MSGTFSRNKGARAERELCGLLRDHLGGEFSRNLKQYQKSQEGDVEQLVGPYLIECKAHATLNLKAWWGQVSQAASRHAERPIPCLAYKVPRKGWRFRVPMREAWASGQQWGRELTYTMDLSPDGFFLLVREHGQ
jgi:Holliday junction resolvase